MVEHLAVGSEVETCHMAEGLSGKKGTIVYFNKAKQRYTIELDDGDMMSLRIHNIREINDTTSSTDGATNNQCGIEGSSRENDTGRHQQQRNSIMEATLSLRNILICIIAVLGYKIMPMALYTIQNFAIDVGDISLPILICFGVTVYFMWKFGTKDGSVSFQWRHVKDKTEPYHRWGIFIIPLVLMQFFSSNDITLYSSRSLLLTIFFAWQFGTKGGREEFAWDNVWERVARVNIWEAIHLAGVIQGAIATLNRMSQRRR